MFLSDLSLFAKTYVLYADGANRPRVFMSVERARLSPRDSATCVCVLVCVFSWGKSQYSTTTEPK